MTRPAGSGLADVLAGSHSVTYTARVLTEWDREVLPTVPLSDGRFTFDATAQVCGTGSATITLADVWGRSLAPTVVTDVLSPYGNWLEVTCHVYAGLYHSPTVIGSFEISKPQPLTRGRVMIGGASRTSAESIKVSLADAFAGTAREPITGVQQAPVGGSVLREVEQLTGLLVTADTDAEISALIEYPANRLQAVFDLVQLVGGTPYMRADNTVGIRPSAWPDPSRTLRDGPGGLVSGAQITEWDSAAVYNDYVVITEVDQVTLRSEPRRITDGPLRYGLRREGAWGRYTLEEKVDSFTTQEQLEAYADQRFPAVSAARAVGVSFRMPVDPTIEVGDVLRLETVDVTGVIRVKAIDIGIRDATMGVTAYLA